MVPISSAREGLALLRIDRSYPVRDELRMFYQLIALVGAFVLSVFLTPVCRRIALAVGLVDHPDAHRKLHREPIALCGGPTILISSLIAAFLAPLFVEGIRNKFWNDPWPLIGLSVGAVAIVLIGLIPVLMLHKAIAGGRTGGPS